MKDEFFIESEKNDYKYFEDFCNDTKFFEDVKKNEKYSMVDAKGIRNGRDCNIELKMRMMDMNKYDTIFIECNKVSYLMLDYVSKGIIPYYVNFFQDKNHLAIWNLLKLNDFGYINNVKIRNIGYEKTVGEPRHLLYLRDAKIFVLDGEHYREV